MGGNMHAIAQRAAGLHPGILSQGGAAGHAGTHTQVPAIVYTRMVVDHSCDKEYRSL
jgi:hypothetical protein